MIVTEKPVSQVTPPSEKACDHCGEISPANFDSNGQIFCCHGCMGAYSLIHQMGLDDYYAFRANNHVQQAAGNDKIFQQKGATLAAIEMLSDLEAAGVEVRQGSDGLCEVRLGVEGLHCAACSWLIERMQPTLTGVHSAQVRMSDRSIRLVYDPAATSPSEVASRLAPLGYLLLPKHDSESNRESNRSQQHEHLIAIAVSAFLAANAMWIGIALYAGEATGMLPAHTLFLRWIGTLLGVLAAVFPGRIFIRSAYQAIKTRTAHVDIPIAIALVVGVFGAVAGSIVGKGHIYFDSLASLVLLLRVGRYIQFRSQYLAGLSLEKLFRWTNGMATRIAEDGSQQTVATSQLQPNDLILVHSGETLPTDGIVVEGRSHLNVSWLTGESLPQSVTVGDRVVGGTMNIDAPLQIRVSECGKRSRLGLLEEVIRNAAGERTPLVRAADKIGSWFVITVLLLSVACWVVWFLLSDIPTATMHTVALLTIACPCAIALAAPLVITVAIGRAARRQIWIRDGQSLELLAKPGMMWFDKTGTLTSGIMHVRSWVGSEIGRRYAFEVESQINHPIANAICKYLRTDLTPHDSTSFMNPSSIDSSSVSPCLVQAIEGLGVVAHENATQILIGSENLLRNHSVFIDEGWSECQRQGFEQGDTVVWIAVEGEVEGVVCVGDTLRPDAVQTLQSLQSQGWKLGILSGDRLEVVHSLEKEFAKKGVLFEAVKGEVTPEEKVAVVRETRRHADKGASHPVVLVGDGINDAAALTVADVGIAMRGGSDISLRAAPIYIANNRLACIDELLNASRATLHTIRKCFAISLVYNSITISLAVLGLIHPLIAAVFMPISGLTVLGLAITGRSFEKENLR